MKTITFINTHGQTVELTDTGSVLGARLLPPPGVAPTGSDAAPAGHDPEWVPLWTYYQQGKPTPALAYDVVAHVMDVADTREPSPELLDTWARWVEAGNDNGEHAERSRIALAMSMLADDVRKLLAPVCPFTSERCDRQLEGYYAPCKSATACELEATRRRALVQDLGGMRKAFADVEQQRAELVKQAHATLDDALGKLPLEALRALVQLDDNVRGKFVGARDGAGS